MNVALINIELSFGNVRCVWKPDFSSNSSLDIFDNQSKVGIKALEQHWLCNVRLQYVHLDALGQLDITKEPEDVGLTHLVSSPVKLQLKDQTQLVLVSAD